MLAIAVKEQQYKTYVLSDQTAQSEIEVVPERGGIITKWCYQGQEILYLDAERFANPNLSVRGGIPILFPICGNLPDNTYTHHKRVWTKPVDDIGNKGDKENKGDKKNKGDKEEPFSPPTTYDETYNIQKYTLKQHGFARDLPWEVTEQVTEGFVSITLVLESNKKTREVYPFDFKIAFTYQLKGNRLEIRQRYTNCSEEQMPFSTGLHPYFYTADKTQLQLRIPAKEYQDQRTNTVHPFTGSFDFDTDEIDVAFRDINSPFATAIDNGRQLRISLSYDEAYSTLVFWTVKGKDFYCLEPWTAPRNALNTNQNLIRLEPDQTFETIVGLSVSFS
ncbi:MAG TPA: aldose epimerase [Leptolyngbyaceae cyanobacterium]